MSDATLFLVANYSVLPFWLLLVVAPRWRWTDRLACSALPALYLVPLYAFLLFNDVPGPQGASFLTLEGVMQIFTTPRPVIACFNPKMVTIRRATFADMSGITEIYNEAILTTTATFDTEPKTPEERTAWLESRDERHPVLVAVVDGQVVGWGSLSEWSDRCAYADTAETSFYVRSSHQGRGIGRHLKEAIIEEARRLKYHTIIARVAEGSSASLHLNESMGFVHVGTLKEVGRKFGRLLDVHILQKMLT